MRRNAPVARLAAAIALLVLPLAAQVIPVSGGGPALALAVAAAPSGAVLLVAPGTYDAVSFVLNKDVTIVAPQRATVTEKVEALAGNPTYTLRLAGIRVVPVFPPYMPYPLGGDIQTIGHLQLEDCVCSTIRVPNAAPRRRVHIANTLAGSMRTSELLHVDAVLVDSTFTGGQWGKSSYAGLRVTGSLRVERIQVMSGTSSTGGVGLYIDGQATIADSQIYGHNGLPGYGPGLSIYNTPPGALTLSNCTTPEGIGQAHTIRPLVTAAWQLRAWAVGGTSTLRIHSSPNAPIALVAAWDLLPWQPAIAAEMVYAGSTPLWFVAGVGTADAQGDFHTSFAIPNSPAVRHLDAWLTGLDLGTLPLRTSVPIGGVIR